MLKYPKIGQFRQTVKNVSHKTAFQGLDENKQPIYDGTIPKPTLPFRGTVKLHGSNGSIVIYPDDRFEVQSRNRVLTLDSDNAGFAMFVLGTVGKDAWVELTNNMLIHPEIHNQLRDYDTRNQPVALYGEWAGGNIQQGVAISELEKMFVIFGLRVGAEEKTRWVDIKPFGGLDMDDKRIFSIYDERFPHYEVEIDFERPGEIQNKMIEITEAVEKECPVGKALGVSGTGEGVVWKCTHPDYNDSGFWFKVKGNKHSASKVKKLAPVDVEKMKTVEEFVQNTVTENRCRQGIEFLKEQQMEVSQKNTGAYIRWVIGDIMSEELDTMVASNITQKELGKPVSTAARKWFFNYLNNELGLEH